MSKSDPDHRCPLCGNAMEAWLSIPGDSHLPQNEIDFEGFWCRHDQFGKILPTPPQDIINKHYELDSYYTRLGEEQALENHSAKRERKFFDKVREKIAFKFDKGEDTLAAILQRLGKKPARVLEIGCGHGDILMIMRANGHECVGIEPDPNSKARQIGFDVKIYNGTAENPPSELDGEKFDCVIMSHVLEHCTDTNEALRSVKRFLKEDGFVVIEVPNILCADFKFSSMSWPHLDVPRHLNFFSEKSLKTSLELADLNLSHFSHRHYGRQMTNEWISFSKPVFDYYNSKGALGWTFKKLGALYYWFLLGITALAPKNFKYDSIAAFATNTATISKGDSAKEPLVNSMDQDDKTNEGIK